MQIDTFVLGDFATNSYVVRSSATARRCLVIDPGYDPGKLVAFIRREALEPEHILLTHGHCDHIAGIPAVRELREGIPVHISQADAVMLVDSQANLSALMGAPVELALAEDKLVEEATFKFDGMEFSLLPTPGHTAGGMSFYCAAAGVVFSGDSLFAGSIGRTDFPGGNMVQLLKSIRERLLVLPEETRVLSGHGPETTIGKEKGTNPYIL